MEQDSTKTLFVGRETELAKIEIALDAAFDGSARLLLFAGEPGIGKTRLAEQAAAQARGRAAKVLWGRCWEGDGAPAFWPWEQVIRAYVEDSASASLLSQLGPEISDVTRFVPELRKCMPSVETQAEGGSREPGQLRFRVFDSVRRFFQEAALKQPHVIILDDLHRADQPSIILLQFLMNHLLATRILVVGTYRESDLAMDHGLAQPMTELVRLSATEKVSLRGLQATEVRRFMAEVAGDAATAWVDAVLGKSDGNPFFVTELVQLLERDGMLKKEMPSTFPLEIPQTIRDVIRCRLSRLSELCNHILGSASVIGREFDLEIVTQAIDVSAVSVLHGLDEAISAGVLTRVSDIRGRHRFNHMLIRDTLYEELPTTRRVALHRAVAAALEEIHAGDLESSLPLLAHHSLHGSVGGDRTKAVDYSVGAGRKAAESLAYEEAALWFQRALEALGRPRDRTKLRCEVLLEMGSAQHRGGDTAAARATFLEAAPLARRLRNKMLFSRAALGFGWEARTGFVDKTLVKLLDEALELQGPEDSELRVRLLSRLSRALYWSGSPERSLQLSEEAVAMAERVGGCDTQAAALTARYIALWGPDTVARRRSATRLLQNVVTESDDPETIGLALRCSIIDHLEEGEIQLALEKVDCHSRLVRETKLPFLVAESALFGGMYTLLTGRFSEAERQIREVSILADKLQSRMLALSCTAQTVMLGRLRGAWDELEPQVESIVREYPALPVWRAVHNSILASVHPERATEELDRLIASRSQAFPRDGNWLVSWAFLSDSIVTLGHLAAARIAYDSLRPFGGRNIVVGYAAACDGPVAHYLGILATAMGQLDLAEGHFRHSILMASRLGAPPLIARTQFRYSEMLIRRACTGDLALVDDLLPTAIAVFRSYRMHGMACQASELRQQVPLRGAHMGLASEAASESGRIRAATREPHVTINSKAGKEEASLAQSCSEVAEETVDGDFLSWGGDFWTIGFEGRVLRVRDLKGMRQTAYLIFHPESEVPALELARLSSLGVGTWCGAREGGADFFSRAPGLGDAGVLADSQALREYLRELDRLSEQAEEAERCNETEKATALRAEAERIQGQLGACFGPRGRSRFAASAVERARVSVRNNMMNTWQGIQKQDKRLWRHLFSSVRTGAFCSYRAERPIRGVRQK